jgi:hypothetical protein
VRRRSNGTVRILGKRSLKRDARVRYAQMLNLNVERFRQELDNRTYQRQVEMDSLEAKGLGVTSTPTFRVLSSTAAKLGSFCLSIKFDEIVYRGAEPLPQSIERPSLLPTT